MGLVQTMRRVLTRAALLALIVAWPASTARSGDDPVYRAYEALSPRERVGQLFLIAFSRGDDDAPAADALELITEYGVGGLVLQKGNQIFANELGRDLPHEIASLTAELQRGALGDGGPGIPLFIAVDHEGDGDPFTHLREGFTAIPSPMALGATWDPANVEAIGTIVGQELAAVGVNLLLGPGLDVLAEPRVDSQGDIGTRSFGGDPYWVAQMGRAYIRGVHRGSRGRVATVAKHFPGHGGSDRLPDEEVATVNKSLLELRRIELPPFAAVTSGPAGNPDDPAITDGLMTSHIRYRGFQGNIRRGTKPISIDPEALRAILELNGFPFGSWHEGNGLMIADSLGVRALRRFDDPSGLTFRHRDVARKALEAGNDVLVLAQFAITPAWSVQRGNIEDVIRYFAAQYVADATFRSRVDEAALRVLHRKAALYPEWSADAVTVRAEGLLDTVGTDQARDTVARISAAAVTVLRRQGEGPQAGQRIVVITDDDGRLACKAESCGLPPERRDALSRMGDTLVEAAIIERYGPSGTGIIRPADMTALTFCELQRALGPTPPEPPPPAPSPSPGEGPSVPDREPCPADLSPEEVLARLRGADWILFAFADLQPNIVRDLTGFYLHQVNGLVQRSNTRVAALSFGPPYYIDATNYSHLDTYIAAYSKNPPSVEAAVDVLFGDRPAAGAPPVTIRNADYDLTHQLEPDPDEPFDLRAVSASDDGLPARVVVEIGPIWDRNGHPVPDETEIDLTTNPPGVLDGGPVKRVHTVGGRIRTELVFPQGGHVTIRAVSGDAVARQPLVLALPEPSPTPVPTGTRSPALSRGALPGGGAPDTGHPGLGIADLLLSVAAIVLVTGAAVTSQPWRRRNLDEQTRTALLVAVGGMGSYIVVGALLVYRSPAVSRFITPGLQTAYVMLTALLGALAGLAAGWWLSRTSDAHPPTSRSVKGDAP